MHNFSKRDADDWYRRNSSILANSSLNVLDINFIYDVLKDCRSEISHVLEIGCATGRKTQLLSELFGARGFGVDISEEAILAAQTRTTELTDSLQFLLARGEELDFPNGFMDLVYVGFCFYVMDNSEFESTLSCIDQILGRRKFLAVLDFDFGVDISKPDRRNPRMSIFKRDYLGILHSDYNLLAKWSYSHSSNKFSLNEDERIAISIFQKRR